MHKQDRLGMPAYHTLLDNVRATLLHPVSTAIFPQWILSVFEKRNYQGLGWILRCTSVKTVCVVHACVCTSTYSRSTTTACSLPNGIFERQTAIRGDRQTGRVIRSRSGYVTQFVFPLLSTRFHSTTNIHCKDECEALVLAEYAQRLTVCMTW